MNFLPDFHWANPGILFLGFLIPPLLAFRIYRQKRTAVQAAVLQILPPSRLRQALFYIRYACEGLVLLVALAALAGPHRSQDLELIREEGIDVALVLDVSASMMAADFPPNRLEALKELSKDFVRRSGSNRLAVFAFAKDTFTQSPLTTDHDVLIELVDGLAYEMIDHSTSGGTAIGDALLAAGTSLAQNRIEGRDQVIILITDGESNFGADPLLAARFILDKKIRLHVIGLAGPVPIEVYINGKPFITTDNTILKTSLDDKQLREIAKESHGEFYRASDHGILTRIFDQLSRLERTPLEIQKMKTRTYFVSPLAWAALGLFALWLILSLWVRRPLL